LTTLDLLDVSSWLGVPLGNIWTYVDCWHAPHHGPQIPKMIILEVRFEIALYLEFSLLKLVR